MSRAQLTATEQLQPRHTTDIVAGPPRPIRQLADDAERIARQVAERRRAPGDMFGGWPAPTQADLDAWAATQAALDRQRDAVIRAALADPAPHLLNTLGPPPLDGPERWAWAKTAGRIETYRAAQSIDDPDTALGPQPDHGPARVDWHHTQAAIHRHQHRDLDQGLTL